MDVPRRAVDSFYWPVHVAGHHPYRGFASHGCWSTATDCRRPFERSVYLELDRFCRRLPWRISVVVGRGHDLRGEYRLSPEAGRTHSAGVAVARGGSEENASVDQSRPDI